MKALEKIAVRRPALPPRLLQEAPGLQQEATPPSRRNPEFEEKPLAELDTQKSENLHGGSELTFSTPSQRQGAEHQRRPERGVNWTQLQDRIDVSKYFKESVEMLYILSLLRRGGDLNELQMADLKAASSPARLRYLQSEFYRLIEMIAEEETKQFDNLLCSKTRYNVKKMIMRRYEGKPPTRYKMQITREGVVLILDNSGSMVIWTNMLAALAELAAQRHDVEIYVAPNGRVKEQISPTKREVNHDSFVSRTVRRTIIYVGDFDGGDTPVRLSWQNTVYWIAPEGRYRRFTSHDWMHYDEQWFKGFFIRVFTLEDMFDAMKKAITGVRWIDKCDACEDERDEYEEYE